MMDSEPEDLPVADLTEIPPTLGDMFMDEWGQTFTFSMPICPEKDQLRKLITEHGGSLVSVTGGPHVIRLVPPGMKATSSHFDLFSTKFIEDCLASEKVLDLGSYRIGKSLFSSRVNPNDVMTGKISWQDCEKKKDDSGDEVSDFEDGEGHIEVSKSKYNFKSGRREYEHRERRAILNYIIDNKKYNEVKGKRMWEEMVERNICSGRSWESMKEHFRKNIINNLQLFKLSEKTVRRLIAPFSKGHVDIVSSSSESDSSEDPGHDVDIGSPISKTVMVKDKPSPSKITSPNFSHSVQELEDAFRQGSSSDSTDEYIDVQNRIVDDEAETQTDSVVTLMSDKSENVNTSKKIEKEIKESHPNHVKEILNDDRSPSNQMNEKSQSSTTNNATDIPCTKNNSYLGSHSCSNQSPVVSSEADKCENLTDENVSRKSQVPSQSIQESQPFDVYYSDTVLSSSSPEKNLPPGLFAGVDGTPHAVVNSTQVEKEVGSPSDNEENSQSLLNPSDLSDTVSDSLGAQGKIGLIRSPIKAKKNGRCSPSSSSSLRIKEELCESGQNQDSPQIKQMPLNRKSLKIHENSYSEWAKPHLLQSTVSSSSFSSCSTIIFNSLEEEKNPPENDSSAVKETSYDSDLSEKKKNTKKRKGNQRMERKRLKHLHSKDQSKKSSKLSSNAQDRDVSNIHLHLSNNSESEDENDISLRERQQYSSDEISEKSIVIRRQTRMPFLKANLNNNEVAGEVSDADDISVFDPPNSQSSEELQSINSSSDTESSDEKLINDPAMDRDNFSSKFDKTYYPRNGIQKGTKQRIANTVNKRTSRAPYSDEEDVKILKYIIKYGAYDKTGGRELWQGMVRRALPERSWHSLKERYRMRISQRLPYFTRYGIPESSLRRLAQKAKGNNANVKSESVAENPRKSYSRNEDLKILKFICENKRHSQVGGKMMWELMSQCVDGLTSRTWLSLKERFRRTILKNLHSYPVTKDDIRRFTKRKEKGPNKICSFFPKQEKSSEVEESSSNGSESDTDEDYRLVNNGTLSPTKRNHSTKAGTSRQAVNKNPMGNVRPSTSSGKRGSNTGRKKYNQIVDNHLKRISSQTSPRPKKARDNEKSPLKKTNNAYQRSPDNTIPKSVSEKDHGEENDIVSQNHRKENDDSASDSVFGDEDRGQEPEKLRVNRKRKLYTHNFSILTPSGNSVPRKLRSMSKGKISIDLGNHRDRSPEKTILSAVGLVRKKNLNQRQDSGNSESEEIPLLFVKSKVRKIGLDESHELKKWPDNNEGEVQNGKEVNNEEHFSNCSPADEELDQNIDNMEDVGENITTKRQSSCEDEIETEPYVQKEGSKNLAHVDSESSSNTDQSNTVSPRRRKRISDHDTPTSVTQQSPIMKTNHLPRSHLNLKEVLSVNDGITTKRQSSCEDGIETEPYVQKEGSKNLAHVDSESSSNTDQSNTVSPRRRKRISDHDTPTSVTQQPPIMKTNHLSRSHLTLKEVLSVNDGSTTSNDSRKHSHHIKRLDSNLIKDLRPRTSNANSPTTARSRLRRQCLRKTE